MFNKLKKKENKEKIFRCCFVDKQNSLIYQYKPSDVLK